MAKRVDVPMTGGTGPSGAADGPEPDSVTLANILNDIAANGLPEDINNVGSDALRPENQPPNAIPTQEQPDEEALSGVLYE